jgi:hypothetical protein
VAGFSDIIHWHPGFYGAAELELRQNKEELEFEREYNLSKEPLKMDLLIVKKHSDVVIKNEIGRIFKKFNVLEYKSPDDGMSIDDYYKTVGYACLYKGLGDTVNAVPAEELTVSMFRESYPSGMMEALEKQGAVIENRFPGIYYVTGGTLFDTQIVVTGRLDPETHSSLRLLSKNVQAEDVRRFLSESEALSAPGDKNNVDAVLEVSISANGSVYEKIKEDLHMCEALEKLMQKEIDEKVSEGKAAGIAEGIAEGKAAGIAEGKAVGIAEGKAVGIAEGKTAGKLAALTELVKDGILTVSDAAKRANMTEAVFIEKTKNFKV